MRTFKAFRKSLKSRPQMSAHSVSQPVEDLQEDSWLSKGYAIGQSVRHSSMKQQISNVLSTVTSICEKGKNEKDVAVKLNLLFDALQQATRVFRGLTELSNSNINVSIASALLAQDLQKVISSELAKIEKRR